MSLPCRVPSWGPATEVRSCAAWTCLACLNAKPRAACTSRRCSDVNWLSLDADNVRSTAARVVCLAYFFISIFLIEAYAGEVRGLMEHWGRPVAWGGRRAACPLPCRMPSTPLPAAANLAAYLTVAQLENSVESWTELRGKAVGTVAVRASAAHGMGRAAATPPPARPMPCVMRGRGRRRRQDAQLCT